MEFAMSNVKVKRSTMAALGWQIEYAVWTNAKTSLEEVPVVVGFHGFARPLEDLKTVHEAWPVAHTMISIHLPHHGASKPITDSGPIDQPISPATLNRIIEAIIEKEIPKSSQRTLLGYSIGGRIALALTADAPDKWNQLILLAPDGLKKSPFYTLTVHTRLGRWIWFFIDRNEKRVWKWTDTLYRWGLISQHLHGFAYFHTESHEMRMMVWNGWRSHRACWPNHRSIVKSLTQVPRVKLIFGEFDKIIPYHNSKRLRKLTQGLEHVSFHSIRSGHNMLKPETTKAVIRIIFDS